jgi:hypothetical protein
MKNTIVRSIMLVAGSLALVGCETDRAARTAAPPVQEGAAVTVTAPAVTTQTATAQPAVPPMEEPMTAPGTARDPFAGQPGTDALVTGTQTPTQVTPSTPIPSPTAPADATPAIADETLPPDVTMRTEPGVHDATAATRLQPEQPVTTTTQPAAPPVETVQPATGTVLDPATPRPTAPISGVDADRTAVAEVTEQQIQADPTARLDVQEDPQTGVATTTTVTFQNGQAAPATTYQNGRTMTRKD